MDNCILGQIQVLRHGSVFSLIQNVTSMGTMTLAHLLTRKTEWNAAAGCKIREWHCSAWGHSAWSTCEGLAVTAADSCCWCEYCCKATSLMITLRWLNLQALGRHQGEHTGPVISMQKPKYHLRLANCFPLDFFKQVCIMPDFIRTHSLLHFWSIQFPAGQQVRLGLQWKCHWWPQPLKGTAWN